jgi:BirA family biotin operon repressor/biotin-[acetyl-CoA-carboxylase] ligase
MLSEEQLRKSLPVSGLGQPFYYVESAGSTNDMAASLAREGASHGTLVIAESQTAGRGRAGKRWITPMRSALAFSLVIRSGPMTTEELGGLVVLGALGVTEALKGFAIEPEIKWPNDVIVGEKKIAGVLVEASWLGDELEYAILGIGVNIHPESVPKSEELDFPATCADAEAGAHCDRIKALTAILESIGSWLPLVGSDEIVREWEKNLAYRDCIVTLVGPDLKLTGEIVGLSPEGQLRIKLEDENVISVHGGDVHLRSIDSGLN